MTAGVRSHLGEGRETALLGRPAGRAGFRGLAESLSSAPQERGRGLCSVALWLDQKSHLSQDFPLADPLPRGRETTGMGPLRELEGIELSGRARQNLSYRSPGSARRCVFPVASILGGC